MTDIVDRLLYDPMPRPDATLPPTPREAELLAEIERLQHLVECAYGEGIVDVSYRGARISEDNDTWETSDAKVAMDDIEYHRLMWPEHFQEAARKDEGPET